MFKRIGLSLIYLIIFLGLYGCSCSENPKEVNLEAGLYVADLNVNEQDDGTQEIEVAVNLQRENQDPVTVNYEVQAFTSSVDPIATGATNASSSGADFLLKQGQLNFSAESNNTQKITVTIVNDTLYEHDEIFLVSLSASSGAKVVDGEATITIVDNDPKPVASLSIISDLADSTFNENEVDSIQLKIELDKASGVTSKLRILGSTESSADEDGFGKTAAYRVDYLIKDAENTLLKKDNVIEIAKGETEAIVNVSIVDDGTEEVAESFNLRLTEIADVNVSGADLDFTIIDNDSPDLATQFSVPLNDTGMTKPNGVIVEIDDLPPDLTNEEIEFQTDQLEQELQNEMDFAIGRDAENLTKTGGGRAGFDFTRLDSEGNEVVIELAPGETSALDYVVPWDCVRDNNTGLVWEVKVRGNLGVRAAGRDFYWYDPNYSTNGGVPGAEGDFSCEESDPTKEVANCNTSYYVADINASQLCGLTGWRLPTRSELRSIVDYNTGGSSGAPSYDTDYFAGDTLGDSYYWTSTSFAVDPTKAWTIYMRSGSIEQPRGKATEYVDSSIRLVNDSLIKQAQQQ